MGLVSDRLLAAAFFIPKENRQQNQPIEALLQKAGAINIQRTAPDRMIECQWARMACQAYTHNELTSHQLFVIQFMQSVFLGRGKYSEQENNLPLEKDGNLKLVLTFRDACEVLKPEVAYIATHTYDAEFESIVKNIERIESYNAIEIAGDAGLLYMRGIIADCLVDPPPEYMPDKMPVSEGVLIFAGTGNSRWR